jgi:hypothetical protein
MLSFVSRHQSSTIRAESAFRNHPWLPPLSTPTKDSDNFSSRTVTIRFYPLRRPRWEIDICPRWVLARLRIAEQSQYHVSLLASALFTLAILPIAIHLPHFCLMKTVLGIPCPGCGVCHLVLAILHLKPVMAWEANPAGVGIASVFCFQLMARPMATIAPRTRDLVSRASHRISNVALAGLLLVWISRVF